MSMKLVVAARRRPGMSRSAYAAYVEYNHGGIVSGGPADFTALHRRYRQNHVRDGIYGAGVTAEYDSVSELWFANPTEMKAATQHPYYLSTVAPDEPKFGNQSNLIVLMTKEEELRPAATPAGNTKLMLFAFRSAELDREQFTAQWRAALTAALASPALAERIGKAVLSLPLALPAGASGDFAGGTPPNQCDGVASFNLTIDDPMLLDEVYTALEGTLSEIQDANRSFTLLVREVVIIDQGD